MAKYYKCFLQKNMKYGPYFRRMLRGHYRLGLSYSTNTGNFLDFYGRLTFAYVYFFTRLYREIHGCHIEFYTNCLLKKHMCGSITF